MFLTQTPDWQILGAQIVAELTDKYGADGVLADRFALVLAVPVTVPGTVPGPQASMAEGFAHRAMTPIYPCSLVKTFHLVQALAALEAGRIAPHGEMDRAMRDMIRWSSNGATNYVIDLITGTTGDTLLEGAEYLDWVSKRERLNRFFWAMGWPEWQGCNISQKLMDDTRYGREAQFAGVDGSNLNALTPMAAARLMWELFQGDLPLSPPVRARAQAILARDPASADAVTPAYQLGEYLGGALPRDVKIWSKAGHNEWTGDAKTSWFKHDMLRLEAPGRKPLVLVMTTQGQRLARDVPQAFPAIGRLIWEMTAEICAL